LYSSSLESESSSEEVSTDFFERFFPFFLVEDYFFGRTGAGGSILV
jgi:hypothetical protein